MLLKSFWKVTNILNENTASEQSPSFSVIWGNNIDSLIWLLTNIGELPMEKINWYNYHDLINNHTHYVDLVGQLKWDKIISYQFKQHFLHLSSSIFCLIFSIYTMYMTLSKLQHCKLKFPCFEVFSSSTSVQYSIWRFKKAYNLSDELCFIRASIFGEIVQNNWTTSTIQQIQRSYNSQKKCNCQSFFIPLNIACIS